MTARGLMLLALSVLSAGCRDEKGESKPVASQIEAEHPEAPAQAVVDEGVSVLGLLDTCDVSHRGAIIDVGSVAAQTQRAFSQMFERDVVLVPHGGGSFAEVLSRRVDYEFRLSEAREALHVGARVRGRRSGRMAAYIDNRRLGSARLVPDEVRVVSFTSRRNTLEPGRHQLSLRFSRGEPHQQGAYAEVEWIRLTSPDEADEQYGAPTLKDIVSDVALEKRPRRTIALREQSSVRCPVWPAADSELQLWLGFWGKGSGRAEVRVLRHGQAPFVLAERELKGGDNAGWTPLELPLGKYAGSMIGIEFAVPEARGVGRVAFADPALVRAGPEVPSSVPRTDTVLLVVLSGLRRQSLPPWGSPAKLPAFGEMLRAGTAFTNYRAPSSVPAAALASMLTGKSPREHTLEDPAARLPSSLHTLNEALKQASGRAAMFTGVPTSFPAFGFDHGWDEYEAISPVSNEPAHAPFDKALAWLKRDVEQVPSAKRLVVIHARGGHPPWDVSKAEAQKLKPEEYNGAIDARRGGIALGNIRARTRRASRRLAADDWTRLYALELAALKKQDEAFARLGRGLKEMTLWEDALVIVVGDVGAGEAPKVPYHPAGPLAESGLYVPLVVKFPGRRLAGKESGVGTTAEDIALTIKSALGLDDPPMSGFDVFRLAAGAAPVAGRALWATHGNDFATRLGPWRLSGELGTAPTLCELAVDPACVNDVFGSHGFIASSLWKWTYLLEKRAREARSVSREPASVDDDTSAALAVWGDLQ